MDLIRRCASSPGDGVLWQEFVRRFDDFLRLSAIKLLGISGHPGMRKWLEIVEDIVQEVYVRLLKDQCKALNEFRGKKEEAIFPYLYSITGRVISNYFRARRAQKRSPVEKSLDETIYGDNGDYQLGTAILPGSLQMSEAELGLAELQDEINCLLDQILRGSNKSRDKLIFQLFYYDNLTSEEIAQIPGIELNPHGVEVVLSRIRRRLAKFAGRLGNKT